MSSKEITTTICDGPHDTEVLSVITRTITVDGETLQADECAVHALPLEDALTLFRKYARPVKASAQPQRARPETRRREHRARAAAIRAAWTDHPECSDKQWKALGRIPGEVVTEYNAAHPPTGRLR